MRHLWALLVMGFLAFSTAAWADSCYRPAAAVSTAPARATALVPVAPRSTTPPAWVPTVNYPQVFCWGSNSYGQVGDGGGSDRYTPTIISHTALDWTRVAAGDQHVCALRGGAAYCWGLQQYGRLGNGITAATSQTTPTPVSGGFTDWVSVSPGSTHTCGLRQSKAYCWGYGSLYRLGTGNTNTASTPTLVSGSFTDWTAVAAGNTTACGIRGGRAYCWGYDLNGAIGDGTTGTQRTTPALVLGGFTDWSAISAGDSTSCGIRNGGVMYCWGDSQYGKTGDEQTSTDRTTPVLVAGGFTDWTAVSVGYFNVCGIRGGGLAYCWGAGSNGKVGDGASTTRSSPSLLYGGFTDWEEVSAGMYHSCGRRRNGQVYCWGEGGNGKLGNNQTSVRTTPSLVYGGYTDWIGISAGWYNGCGVRSSATTPPC